MNIKQKIYLVSSLSLIVVILLLWGIISPLVLEIQTTSALVKEGKEKLVVLEKTDKECLKELELDYNNVKEDISLAGSGLLDKEEVVDFFIELENLALSTFNKLEISAEEFPSFTLNLLGDFPSLMKFLGWLENGKYFVDVDSIQIRRVSERELSLKEIEGISPESIKTVFKIKAHIRTPK